MMKKTLQLSLLAVTGFVLVFVTSCSKKSADQGNVIRYVMAEEPPSLNPTISTDQVSFFVLAHVQEGLTAIGPEGRVVPGVAESWAIKGTKATFKLRNNAKWSDGSPVTAHDFVYAWQLVVNPKSASEYAYIMFPVKNAEKITKGELPPTALGVKAIDDLNLEVELERPTSYFTELTAFGVFLPIKQTFREAAGDKFAADADKLLYNGPFQITEWVHGAKMTMLKNPQYWNAESIKIDGIVVPSMTSDNQTRFNLFMSGESDFVGLNADTLKEASQKYRVRRFATGTLFYQQFNFRKGRPTANKNLRRAMQGVVDTEVHVNKIIAVPGNIPGASLFPVWLPGASKAFREEHPMEAKKPNIEQAKKYLEAAKKELGGKIPALVYLTGESPTARKEAEYYQSRFKETLGVEIKVDNQTFKQRLAKMKAGDFDIVAAGWGPDYNDPMTFADLFTTWSENNHGRYASAKYDAAIRTAMNSNDQVERAKAFATVQRLVDEDVVIIPTYEAGEAFLVSDRVDGVKRSVLGGDPLFRYAEIVKK